MKTTVYRKLKLGSTTSIVKEDNSVVSLSYSTRREKIEIQFTTAHIKPISKLLEKLQKMAKQEKKLHQKNLEAELAKINEELNPIPVNF